MDAEESDDSVDRPLTAVTVFVVLGAGFVGLVAGIPWFWAIWAIGFAALVPLVAIFEEQIGELVGGSDDADARGDSRSDALEELKARYACGEIDDREFERRLGRLVENESLDDVEARLGTERRSGGRDGNPSRNRDATRSSARDGDREQEFEQ